MKKTCYDSELAAAERSCCANMASGRPRRSLTLTLLTSLVLTVMWTWSAEAGVYNVRHNLGVRLKNNKYIPRTVYAYKAYAFERDHCVPDLAPDIQNGNGVLGAGGGAFPIPIPTAKRGPTVSDAESHCHGNIAAAGLVYNGFIQVDGYATAVLCPGWTSAFAHAWSAVGARIDVRKQGHKRWEPIVSATVTGSTKSVIDPIVAIVTDLETGAVRIETLLAIEVDAGMGSFSWDGGMLTNASSDFQFTINLDSPWTVQHGTIKLVGVGGMITTSDKTGMFAGAALPPIGASTFFSAPLSNVIEFDYDVTLDPTVGNNVDVDLELSGSGETDDALAANDSFAVVFPDLTVVGDPFHVQPGQQTYKTVTLTNEGNMPTFYNTRIDYQDGTNWLMVNGNNMLFPHSPDSLMIYAFGPPTPGLYKATIQVFYQSSLNKSTFDSASIPVELYVANEFYLPEYRAIRTAKLRLNVSQAGRVGRGSDGNLFSYFSDASEYLLDGSLILGNSAANLSWLFMEGSNGTSSPQNPFGPLYAASNINYDSTSSSSYRLASGKGVNRDSTLGFDVSYYAPKHPDSSDFIIARYKIYKGPNNPGGSVPNVSVAYGVDWDVPADSNAINTAGTDAGRNMIYQRGTGTAPNTNRYAALAAFPDNNMSLPGGFVWENDTYVDPFATYNTDSLWNKMATISGYQATNAVEDLNSVIVVTKGMTIGPVDTLKFSVVLAGVQTGALAGVQGAVDRAKKFICDHVAPGTALCSTSPCKCGDADGNGIWNVSDCVYLIGFIFSGSPVPNPICLGDADGNGIVNVSDVVYLINFIFAGGSAPHCLVMLSPDEEFEGRLERQSPEEATVTLTRASNLESGISAEVGVRSAAGIAGVQFEFKVGAQSASDFQIHKTPRSENMQLFQGMVDGMLKVGLVDLSGSAVIAAGEGPIISLESKGSNNAAIDLVRTVLCDKQARELKVTIEREARLSTMPARFDLDQNYPNPFNPVTTISYSLPKSQQVRLAIYNVLGQSVRHLVDANQPAGSYSIEWDGRDDNQSGVPSGVYFYRISTEGFVESRKMILLK